MIERTNCSESSRAPWTNFARRAEIPEGHRSPLDKIRVLDPENVNFPEAADDMLDVLYGGARRPNSP